jgi:hypothetical protein
MRYGRFDALDRVGCFSSEETNKSVPSVTKCDRFFVTRNSLIGFTRTEYNEKEEKGEEALHKREYGSFDYSVKKEI